MNETPLALDLRDIGITYRGHVRAVDHVTLQVSQGEVVALLGPNGAGKSSLLDSALGLVKPDSGSAHILGMPAREAIGRGLVGVVNQTGALPTDRTVIQTLKLFHSLYQNAAPLDELLARTNLEHLKRRRVGKLSGGEQQRLRLALALLPRPMVLFLDEPTTGMDPTARQEFWHLIVSDVTLIFATHYLAEAETHAQRTVIMSQGRIAVDAPTHELLSQGRARLSVEVSESARDRLSPLLDRLNWEQRWTGTHLEVSGDQLEDAARIVLAEPSCRNLRIVDSSLEEIFAEVASEPEGARA